MDTNTKFLIDECLSPELVEIARVEFDFFATHVPWLGAAPAGSKSWKDWHIVDLFRKNPHVLVTNNRRDFVERYFQRADLDPHEGLVVLIEKGDLNTQIELFRKLMAYLLELDSAMNCLVEINNSGEIRIATWPDPSKETPWADPFSIK